MIVVFGKYCQEKGIGSMQLVDLNIERIIIHQIFQRDRDGNKVTPIQSHEYTNFGASAMNEFKVRVKDALGADSKAVNMEIVNQERRDLASLVNTMIDQDSESFSTSSYDIADKLADSQTTKGIPGGIVVVFSGTYSHAAKKFLGIIKAEVHSGYQKEVNNETNEISLKFVEEILLTPGTRLYKTAGFFEKASYDPASTDLNDKWAVMVSDYQISATDGKAAAQYFYASFLGCGYPQTSARTTKEFYDQTRNFISKLDASEAEKSDLIGALTTYLKVDTSATISASHFAETYFDDVDLQDDYTSVIREAGLPTSAFTKDIEHIRTQLKHRKVSFRSNVKIIGPSQTFKDLVTIETIDGDLDESGNASEWTKIIVKDKIIDQE